MYGSTQEELEHLRSKRRGRMRTGPGPDGSLLPDDHTPELECKVYISKLSIVLIFFTPYIKKA